jgi:hypothetical protein
MEMIVAVVMLGVAMTVAAKMVRDVMSVMAVGRRIERVDRMMEPLLEQMRQDVWNSVAMKTPDDWTLELTDGAGRAVVWRAMAGEEMGEGGVMEVTLERTVWTQQRMVAQVRWPIGAAEARWHSDGAVVAGRFAVVGGGGSGKGGGAERVITRQWWSQLAMLGEEVR